MSDSRSAEPGGSESGEHVDQPMRMTATDLAILAAFCRPYTSGERFPSPASNNKILEELAGNGVFLDLDTLRTHLRNLYARFGVEEGLTATEKRVRLVELVYDHGLIVGWDDAQSSNQSPPIAGDKPPKRSRSAFSEMLDYLRERLLMAAGLVAVVMGLLAAMIAKPWSTVGLFDRGDERISQSAIDDATGTVTYCTGDDVVVSKNGIAHQHARAVEDFNEAFGPELQAKLLEFPEDATEQYEQFRRDLRERPGRCDVFYSDVTWTADFAHNNWLLDLSPYFRGRLDSFVSAMRTAAEFDDKMYGVPKQADAGLLYYRTDRVKDPPTTWEDLYRQAAAPPTKRLRYQGRDYEGLTVAFLEVAYAAGAEEIVTPEHNANLRQGPAYAALQLMVEGIRMHAVPREIVVHKEEESLRAFGRGKADFMRHWPYASAALQAYPKVVGRVGVAPLPAWEDRPRASVLGGHVLVVSASSKNPGAALKLVEYLTSREIIKRDAIEFSLAPTLWELWDDPEVRSALPAFRHLKEAVFNARSRPVTPGYPAVSAAISKNINRALLGQTPYDKAIDAADAAMQEALDEVYGSSS
jgi:multiple sugar transport system substrate-binding protein